jgi:hypothetical protein
MPVYALANYAVTVGSGTNFGSVVVGGVHYAQQFLCDKGTPAQCAAVSAGGAVSTIGVTGSTTAVTQATGTNLHAVIDTGSTTAVTQATSSNLKAQVDPLTAASWGIGTSTQNSTVATNGQLALGQFNTTPTTITSTNMSPIQLDANGNLLVNVKAGGAGGGAVTAADGAIVNLGSLADTAWVSGNGTLTAILKNIANGVAGSIPAGSAIIGNVGIDQTTPGTTNGVVVTNALSPGQAAMSASSPVVLANNQTAADPCMFQAKTNVPISTTSGTTALVTGVSAKKIYVCSLALIANTPAVSVSLSEGSSSTCGTSSQAAVMGVATSGTASLGIPLAVNGGLTLGNGGGTVAATATAANYLCLFQSGTTLVAGNLTFVQQ